MKKKTLKKQILLALSMGMIGWTSIAYALPNEGAYDNRAAATISINGGSCMEISGKGRNNILNWKSFSIERGELVKFMDRNNYLNLVNGFDISRIYGTISGGGIIYLINPYGILFGSGATLDNVGSFIASTRDISDINQEAFLSDPSNTQNVLYTDNHSSRNKDYFPKDSPYVPTISIAEINLTNVPASATKIMLDGPTGVVLKNTAVLDSITYISTKKNGGEIGIGSNGGTISLTNEQKQKIYLTNGSDWDKFNDETNIVRSYKLIHNATGLQAIKQDVIDDPTTPKHYMLAEDIDASTIGSFDSIGTRTEPFIGTLDGMGYEISNLTSSPNGLFVSAAGTIRNFGLTNADIKGTDRIYTGGIAGQFCGSMSNVYVTGSVEGENWTGGLVGMLDNSLSDSTNTIVNSSLQSEIRNSYNSASIKMEGINAAGGIVGGMDNSSLFNVYNTGEVKADNSFDVYYQGTLLYSGVTSEGIGGIAGTTDNTDELHDARILSAHNRGDVTGGYYVGGIVGASFSTSGFRPANIPLGDVYNFGKVKALDLGTSRARRPNSVGGIVGTYGSLNDFYPFGLVGVPYSTQNTLYKSKETGKILEAYYDQTSVSDATGNVINGVNFGNALTSSELSKTFIQNYYGTPNSIAPRGDTTRGTPINNSAINSAIANDVNTSSSTNGSPYGGPFGINSSGNGNEPTIRVDETDSHQVINVNPEYFQEGAIARTGKNGLYIYNVDTRNGHLTMDVYNNIDAFGVVEYYDKDGNYIGSEILERDPTVIDIDLPSVLSGLSGSKNDANHVEAPAKAAQIRVTNNINESWVLATYTSIRQIFDWLSILEDTKKSENNLKGLNNLSSMSLKDIMKSDSREARQLKAEIAEKVLEEIGEGLRKHVSYETPAEVVKVLAKMPVKDLANLMAKSMIDLGVGTMFDSGKTFLEITLGIAENPAVIGYDAMKLVGHILDNISTQGMQQKAKATKPIDIYITDAQMEYHTPAWVGSASH